MGRMKYTDAIDRAIAEAMARDDRILVMGEDVHTMRAPLLARFGPDRVLPTPISEGAFVGAAVGAAMAGLRPVAELLMVDFVAVAMDAVLNHMAKLDAFSGGRWKCPVLLRAPCGGGYGDGGQHEQALWGMLAGIPGLTVAVPSTPADAAGLTRTALEHDGPVVLMEHKLLSELMLDTLGRGGRDTVYYDVPLEGAEGEVSEPVQAVPFGQAVIRRPGTDVTVVSVGVGVHRALTAADRLMQQGISAEVIDLRTLAPLDEDTVCRSVSRTGRLVVVDEDYARFGMSGELAAVVLEAGLAPAFGRVCTNGTIPYARHMEREVLPNVDRIVDHVVEGFGHETRAV